MGEVVHPTPSRPTTPVSPAVGECTGRAWCPHGRRSRCGGPLVPTGVRHTVATPAGPPCGTRMTVSPPSGAADTAPGRGRGPKGPWVRAVSH